MAKDSKNEVKAVYTTGEAADMCHLSQQTIIRCFDNGTLKGFRIPGSKFRRIPRESLEEFIREHNIHVNLAGDNLIRVLVVDDESDIVQLFVDILGDDGRFTVETASTGYEAGIKTERLAPDVVILDYMLPDINGDQVCRSIRANPDLAATKVLIISGVVDSEEIDKLMNAGADAFFKKPFDIVEVMDKIVSLTGR